MSEPHNHIKTSCSSGKFSQGHTASAKPVYLDYNATTPIDKEALELMKTVLAEEFGNPSSSHYYGRQARKRLETARKNVASLINCSPQEIIFTASGTEANNIALQGTAFALQHKGNHIIISSIEHPAVTEVCNYLRHNGFAVSKVPVDKEGIIILEELQKQITDKTILISIMHSNNEIGTLQPVEKAAKIAEDKGIILHTDAAQSIGKVEVDVQRVGAGLLSLAGHKFYAPKGVGALYIKKGTPASPILWGADQEKGLRPGTENIPAIAALGKAAEVTAKLLQDNRQHFLSMTNRLHQGLVNNFSREGLQDIIKLNGHPTHRLPNTLNLSFEGVDAAQLIEELSGKVAFSGGAACHSGSEDISPVLKAIGLSPATAAGAVRFSTGRYTTAAEIDKAAGLITSAVAKLLCPSSSRTETPSKAGSSSYLSQHKASPCGNSACHSPGNPPETERKDEIKLTHFTAGLGCACKLEPSVLEAVVKKLPVLVDDKILVGPEASDDAAVYKINEEQALVLTLDFFNAVVDDPRQFGAIAAANSLSDIYAMGASPLFALNIVGFPIDKLPVEVLSQILAGAIEKTNEAGIAILGGHTIKDVEPKYGLVVAGIAHPGKILTNNTARVGDAVVLTKPLGTGIITSAMKKGVAAPAEEKTAIEVMSQLNKYYADTARQYDVSCCTDITGFGLLGHLSEVVAAANVEAVIYHKSVPRIDGLHRLIAKGITPGGIFSNMDCYDENVSWAEDISEEVKYIFYDAQTSGGLLLTMPDNEATRFVAQCRQKGFSSVSKIGKIRKAGKGMITIR